MKKVFTYADIVDILDAEMKKNIENRSKYITNNGFDNVVAEFDAITCEIGRLLYVFKEAAK